MAVAESLTNLVFAPISSLEVHTILHNIELNILDFLIIIIGC